MSVTPSTTPASVPEHQVVRFQITFFKEHLIELRTARTTKKKDGSVKVPVNTPAAWAQYFSLKQFSNGETVYQSWITSMRQDKGVLDKEKADALCIAMTNAYAKLKLMPKYELSVKKITGKVKGK